MGQELHRSSWERAVHRGWSPRDTTRGVSATPSAGKNRCLLVREEFPFRFLARWQSKNAVPALKPFQMSATEQAVPDACRTDGTSPRPRRRRRNQRRHQTGASLEASSKGRRRPDTKRFEPCRTVSATTCSVCLMVCCRRLRSEDCIFTARCGQQGSLGSTSAAQPFSLRWERGRRC